MDLASRLQFLTLDVISDIAFGKPLGNLRADQDCSSFIKTVEKTFPLIVLLATFPSLAQVFFSRAFKSFRPKDTDAVGLGKLMGYVPLQVIKIWLGLTQTVLLRKWLKKDLIRIRRLGVICSVPSFGMALSNENLRQNLFFKCMSPVPRQESDAEYSHSFAGCETTAITMRATLLYIVTNPHVYSQLLVEISKTPISNPITDEEARKLVYLQAVNKRRSENFPSCHRNRL